MQHLKDMFIGYLRKSKVGITIERQKNAIIAYSSQNNIKLDSWFEIDGSSDLKKYRKRSQIDTFLDSVKENDTVICSELSCLGRSMGQILFFMSKSIEKQVKIICIKENINLGNNIIKNEKYFLEMLRLFASTEKKLISERTKEGMAIKRSQGMKPGRHPGTFTYKLDGREDEIVELLKKGLDKQQIAKIMNVSWHTLSSHITRRKLALQKM